MEALTAELEKIDIRYGEFAKQLYDKYVGVAALKILTEKQLQEDFGLPLGAAATIAAASSSSGESLLWQNSFCFSLCKKFHRLVWVTWLFNITLCEEKMWDVFELSNFQIETIAL